MSLADAVGKPGRDPQALHARGKFAHRSRWLFFSLRSKRAYRQPDGIHMTVEGHRKSHNQLAAAIR